jgi:hypothetical protein
MTVKMFARYPMSLMPGGGTDAAAGLFPPAVMRLGCRATCLLAGKPLASGPTEYSERPEFNSFLTEIKALRKKRQRKKI